MSYLLPHLHTGYAVDQAILSVRFLHQVHPAATATCQKELQSMGLFLQEEDRVVIIRFGHDWDQTCMQMDEVQMCFGCSISFT